MPSLDRSVGFKTRGWMCLAQTKEELQGMKPQNSEPQQSTSLPQAPNVPVPAGTSCWTERNRPGIQSRGVTQCSAALKEKQKSFRPLLFKSSSSGDPPALGGCQPASLHAASSQRLAAKPSEQNIYRKRVSIHHSKAPAYLNLSRRCKSYLKS